MVSSDFCRLSRKLLIQWMEQWSNQKSLNCLTLTRPSQQMLLTLGRVMVSKCWLDQKQFESIKQQTRFLNQCLMTTELTNICFGGNCIRLKMSLKQFGNAAFFKNWKVIRLENVFGIPFFRSRSTNLRKLFSRKFGLGVSHQTFEPATKKMWLAKIFDRTKRPSSLEMEAAHSWYELGALGDRRKIDLTKNYWTIFHQEYKFGLKPVQTCKT